MRQELKYACRSLTRNPVFAIVAIATLAVGIGLNTSLFSMINVMLLRPLPVAHGEELVWISSSSTKPNGPRGNMTYPDVVDLSDVGVLSAATAFGHLPANVAAAGQAERFAGQIVMGNFFEVLGVRPHRGRMLAPADDRPAAARVAVISFALWQRLFGAGDAAIGGAVQINGHPFTIAGIAPRGFRGADVFTRADIWVPLSAAAELVPDMRQPLARTSWWLKSVGRLAPNRTLTEAAAALRVRADALAKAFPESHDGFTVRVDPVRGAAPGDREEVRPLSALLLGVTLTVLFIACANVANLLLVRGMSQGRDIAIRVALGAGRRRLLQQQLLESAVVAAAGGVFGLLFSMWATDALLQFAGVPFDADFTPDRRVLLFTFALSAATALLFGVAPALRATGIAPAPALKSEQGSGDARPRSRLQGVLVSGQLALSMVLLLTAGLFLKSLISAKAVDVGFNPHGRVAMSFNLRMHGYSAERADAFSRALLDRVRSRPGVRSASLAALVPLGGRVEVGGLTLPDRPVDPDARLPNVAVNYVWPRFFATMEIGIVRGRALDERDMAGSPATAVVSETMARTHWPDRDPIGQRFSMQGARGPFVEIVGVASDTITDELNERPWAFAYLPGRAANNDVALLAWVDGDRAQALRSLESEVHALDSSVAVFAPKTLEQHIADRQDGERGLSRILGVMGAIAVTLAAIGLYGVVAYTVARRTREIGVRVALGAQPRDVVRLFVADAARLALVGLAIGVVPAVGVTALLASSLVGVRIADPPTIAAVTTILSIVVLLAAYIPARRATRIDPLAALRTE
jgi:predicted permease